MTTFWDHNNGIVREFARLHTDVTPRDVKNIIDGFDHTVMMKVQVLEPGERVFQYVRNAHGDVRFTRSGTIDEAMNPSLGHWFAWKGATMRGLSINSGGSGRRLLELEVMRYMEGLVGRAAPKDKPEWDWAGGVIEGPSGGEIQIFLPTSAMMGLNGLGVIL